AFTYWGEPEIVIQVPEPFRAFHELVDLGALGTPNVYFPTRRDVIRFLYLHEFCHWWLYLTHGWGSSAEIQCDRYAFANYRRRGIVRPPAVRIRRRAAHESDGPSSSAGNGAPSPARPRSRPDSFISRIRLSTSRSIRRSFGLLSSTAVKYQAMRAVTAPCGPTATAVGTSATPYLRASSGRRDTSTVTTRRPDAR